jgi:hypothetical protein
MTHLQPVKTAPNHPLRELAKALGPMRNALNQKPRYHRSAAPKAHQRCPRPIGQSPDP